jgi:trans-AT polyketide synthase/acyltransferase/oxidoreductase domain-containing protein
MKYTGFQTMPGITWQGEEEAVGSSEAQTRSTLLDLENAVWAVELNGKVGLASGGKAASSTEGLPVLGMVPALPLDSLGDRNFGKTHGTRYAYLAGAMANGISSADLVIALGRAGFIGSFGAGGLSLDRIESSIRKIKEALPSGPYSFNLLNTPNEPALEERLVGIYLQNQLPLIEASAFLSVSAPLVLYRLAGLSREPAGGIVIKNRLIAKISRLEMARRFLEPAPADIVNALLEQNKITPEQAELSRHVPMADDITVEADSGGHTDNRPLVCMIPAFLALRDEIQQKYDYPQPVRIGAAGGIGTPDAALAAFMLGAAYVVTGSVNQACMESAASDHARLLLSQMEMADVAMAPASDMFEMGVKVQVLKRGTMFPMRAQKLYELYSRYNAWEDIPLGEREKLEKTVFKRDFGSIWDDTVTFFLERDPRQVDRGNSNPKDKMALVFRWYLGLSSRWSVMGEKGREMDYQIWTGPAMGAFNNWVKGTYLEAPQSRHAVDVASHILRGCAYLNRLRSLESQGILFPSPLQKYIPGPL